MTFLVVFSTREDHHRERSMKEASCWIFDGVDGDVKHGDAMTPRRRLSRIFRGEIMTRGYPVWGVRVVLWGWRPCGVDSHLRFSLPPANLFLLQDLLLVLKVPQLSVVSADTTLARRQISPIGSHVVRSRGCELQQGDIPRSNAVSSFVRSIKKL